MTKLNKSGGRKEKKSAAWTEKLRVVSRIAPFRRRAQPELKVGQCQELAKRNLMIKKTLIKLKSFGFSEGGINLAGEDGN